MRLEQLTFTRFLAAIAIVFYHAGDTTLFWRSPHTSFIIKHANIGVSYFFILSGFVLVIAYSSKKIDYKKFYINRIARIYPLYLLALLAVATMKLFYKTGCDPIQFALSAFAIQAWIPPYALVLNIPGWSISVEFFFYAMFPLLMNFVYLRKSFKKTILYVISLWVLTQLITVLVNHYFNYFQFKTTAYYLMNHFPPMHFSEFLVGNLSGFLFLKYKDRYNFKYNKIGLLLSVLTVYLLLRYPIPVSYYNGFFAIAFVPFILFLSFEKGILTRILSNRYLVFLGEISYGIYIIQYAVAKYMDTLFQFVGLRYSFYIHLVAVIAIAALCYIVIEKPARDFINSQSKRILEKKQRKVLNSVSV